MPDNDDEEDFDCLPLAWTDPPSFLAHRGPYGDVSGYAPVPLDVESLRKWRTGRSPANPAEAQALVRALDEARAAQLVKTTPDLETRIREALEEDGRDFVAMRRNRNTIEVVYVTRPREVIQIMDLKECLAHFSKTMTDAEKDVFAAALFTAKSRNSR